MIAALTQMEKNDSLVSWLEGGHHCHELLVDSPIAGYCSGIALG